MKYWYEQPLDVWREHEKTGDMFIPHSVYVNMLADAEFECPDRITVINEYGGFSIEPNTEEENRTGDGLHQRGVVICAGGRLLPGAYVTIKLLREFGCDLPVEIWHLGKEEVPDIWRTIFENDFNDSAPNPKSVMFRNAHEYMKIHLVASLSGWQLKCYSMIFSQFEQVLFLDADNHPTKDPTYLFDSNEFIDTGAVFWPDRVPHEADHPLWDIFQVPYREEPAHETGQMLIDKKRCWHALQIAMHCNEFADFHYRYSHGDTALLRFSFHKLNQPFTMIPHRLIEVPVDRKVEDLKTLEGTAYMRVPGDIRACFLQRDFVGDVIFQHRSGGGGAQVAFALKDNIKIQHFQHEDLCLKILAEIPDKLENIPFWERMSLLHPEKISPHRKDAMKAMFDWMGKKSLTIVETGTMRQRDNWHNDGGFTWWFGAYVRANAAASIETGKGNGGIFITVDNDPEAIELSKELNAEHSADIIKYPYAIDYVIEDSVSFLRGIRAEYLTRDIRCINVLILDSFDYDAGKEKQAQAHNLNEVIAALPHMADNSIIVIDDCALQGGGKGGLSVPYLEGIGWAVIHSSYMVILEKK